LTAAAPIIVTALFGAEDQAWFDAERRRYFPAERNRVDAHLTLFHHLPPGIADELKQRLARETRGRPAPEARVTGMMSLGSGVAYRIESVELAAIRDDLADAFAGLLMPQDRAGWRPHVTVQNKVSTTEAKALLAQLRADFRPRTVRVAGLATWWYRGGPWQPLSRHMFA
jgi:hypothetical protein